MSNIWYLWAMGVVLATATPAQTKPDFSGTWTLDLLRSRLDQISPPKSSVIKIEHHEPKIHIEIATVTHSGTTTEAFDLTTDGAESRQTIGGQPCTASVKWGGWDGKRLLLAIQCESPEGTVVTTRRIKLGEKGRIMTTIETVKDKTGLKTAYGFYVKQPPPRA